MWRNDTKCKYMFMFPLKNLAHKGLTHWGRVTHICVGKLTIIGSDYGLSPGWRQAFENIVCEMASILSRPQCVNSLIPGRCRWDFKCLNFKHNSGINILSIHKRIFLLWMLEDLVNGKLTLVQVMAWGHQTPSHYLILCWLIFKSPYGIIRPQ